MKRLLHLILLITLSIPAVVSSQTISLELNPDLKNQMNLTEVSSGTYEIVTQGIDPWVFTRPIPTYNPDEVYVISFDYIATQGLDNLQVFYGTPLDGRNRRIDFGSLSASSNFKTFKAFMKYEVGNWDTFYERFRFDFGKAAGQNITVKNLQLRAAEPDEIISIDLDLTRKNQMDITENPEDFYTINTLPGGDPFIFSEIITTSYNPEETYVLSFDYTAPMGLDDLRIFYGQPISGTRRIDLGPLSPAVETKNFTLIMPLEAPIWNDFYDLFRFDFGKAAGQELTVTNLVLRQPTNLEKKLLEVKETIDLELDFNATSPDLNATEGTEGSYVLNTSDNDPWIRSKPIDVIYDINETYIISFEYRTERPYNELEIFYGPPISGTQKFSVGTLKATDGWEEFVINPKLLLDNFQESNWSVFRFDFGSNEFENKTVEIRNLKLRKPTAQELEEEQNSDKFTSLALNQQLLSYLNTNFTDSISKVKVTDDSVLISGKLSGESNNLYIAEIQPHEYGFDKTEYEFLVPVEIDGEEFNVEVPRFIAYEDRNFDRIYSRWVLLKGDGEESFDRVSSMQWASDISQVALNNLEEEKSSTLKGLDGLTTRTVSNFQDLEDLDIKNMKMNLLLNGVLSLNPTGLSHEFNGKTYYINEQFIYGFDERIKKCTEAGIKPSFVLLIPYLQNEELKRIFDHPDAFLGNYSMANVTSPEGIEYYTALIDFLAERYSRPDQEFGRLDQWIIHNEVDAHTNWTHAGQKPVELYTQIYDRSMRMVHYTIRKHNPTAKVFASFTKHFNSKASSNQNFKSRDVLDTQLRLNKKEGDYEWNIGWHAYPTNLFNPLVWRDSKTLTQFNYNTPEITPRNIEMIDSYVRQKNALYNGKKVRTVLLSENGFNSNPNSNPNANETTQSAAIAYFWKKVHNRLPAIENIQYHRWVDNANLDLSFGLWTRLEGTFDGFDEKKESWYVWEAAGTANEDSFFEPYKAVIGINDWSDIYESVATETTPHTVTMTINGCTASLGELVVSFNGEYKIPQEDGSLIFYNVASNVPQPYEIRKGDVILASEVLNITENTELNISLSAIDTISVKGISPTQIEIQWQSNLENRLGFVIEAKKEGGDFEEIGNVSAETLEYTHSNLISGESYTYRIAAQLDENTLSCYSEEIETKAPFIIVDHKDGDNNRLTNNTIKPLLRLRNEADYAVDLNRLSVRYWFTAENFAPLNFYVDYAQLGTSDVNGSFVSLDQTRNGANYYLEMTFNTDEQIAALENSGEIKTRIAKSNWTNFNEADDFSYSDNNQYVETSAITVYWDGQLIWGDEPEVASEQGPELIVKHQNKDGINNNTIKPNLRIINSGNQNVPLKDVTLRYWFSPESASTLNYNIDYSLITSNQINGDFKISDFTYDGATSYIEVSFQESAGTLFMLSETGEMKFRINKQDWSNFDESDDFSYLSTGNAYLENTKITAYINGKLVWGEEPQPAVKDRSKDDAQDLGQIAPNPAKSKTTLFWDEPIKTFDSLFIIDYSGHETEVQILLQEKHELHLDLSMLQTGIYILKGSVNGQSFSKRLMIN